MSPPAVPSSGDNAVGFDASSPVSKVSAPKKPNAYNDSAEEWRKNVRGDPSFVTDADGNRPDWYWTGKSPSEGCPGMQPDGTITHLPLPNLNKVTRQEVLDCFDNSWTITEMLFSGLQGEEVFYRPPYHNLRHPLIFYYGHPAALYVNKMRVAGIITDAINPYFENIFETGVDEMSWDDLSKNDMMWPSVREVTEYRRAVYKLVRNVIQTHPCLDEAPITWDSPAFSIFMSFEHEGIHIETSSVLFRELPAELVKKPIWWPNYHESVTPSQMAFMNAKKNAMLRIEAGDVVVGKPLDYPTFGWDNEYGRRVFHVREFSASEFLISNGEFLEFVKEGGYRTEEFWTKDGWMWRTFRNAKKPTFWTWAGPQGRMEFKLRLIFEEVPLPLDLPAVVNLHEAKAFCAWRSKKEGLAGAAAYRLLAESEHHRLRDVGETDKNGQPLFDPVTELSGVEMRGQRNTNMAYGSEAAVDSSEPTTKGFYDVHGNVWQWCEDHFSALPNSHGVHVLYDDFSTPCYDGEHSLIMGGSFMSTGDEASVFARFHFRPHFFQHAGFRIVSSQAPLQTTCMDSPGPHVNNWDPSTTKRKATNQETLETIGAQLAMHYGASKDTMGAFASVFGDLANFPQRLAQRLVDACKSNGVTMDKALDVGCSVGGATLELAKSFQNVTGIDVDAASIKMAKQMKEEGSLKVQLKDEGELSRAARVSINTPKESLARAAFRQMDPCCMAPDMQGYDAVIMANLLERTASPKAPLGRAIGQAPLVRVGGLILVASTFSWEEDIADKKLWLGGFSDKDGASISSANRLREFLEQPGSTEGVAYELVEEFDAPFAVPKSTRAYDVNMSYAVIMRRVR